MQKIDTISSVEGRRILHSLFREFRFERQMSNLKILLITFQICVFGKSIKNYSSKDVDIQHKVGILNGFSIWMEEIINRFFFSSVLSFVYFGAAFLILIVGLNRFTNLIPQELLALSIIFETSMLILMFITMLFSPNDDSYYIDINDNSETQEELLVEIGEIGRDLAAVVVQLEKLGASFNQISTNQQQIVEQLGKITNQNETILNPSDKMLEHFTQTGKNFENLNSQIENLNLDLENLKKEKISSAVKEQLDKIIENKLK